MMGRMDTSNAHPLEQLAQAATLIQQATDAVAQLQPPAGHAAYFGLLVERLNEQLVRAQVHAADAIRRTGAHQLDPESLDAIRDAGLHPSPAALRATEGKLTRGRSTHNNAVDLLHGWLNIPLSTARERLHQADALIATVDATGTRGEPLLPELAEQFTGEQTDPRLLLSAARQIRSVKKDLGTGPTAAEAQEKLEQDALSLIREQPQTARKHLSRLVEQCRSAQRPLDALLSEVGFYRRGLKGGLVYYYLKVLPQDAEMFESVFSKIDNPKTLAGNRDALNAAIAARYGSTASDQNPAQAWGDPSDMPDWARATPTAPVAPTAPTASEDPTAGKPATEQPNPSAEQPAPAAQPATDGAADSSEARPVEPTSVPPAIGTPAVGTPAELALPLEEVRPEFRHLMALLELIRGADGVRDGTAGPGLTPEVVVILNYEKMLAGASDFAITANGLPLAAGAARTLMCQSKIYPEVLGSKGMVLDFGRSRRLFPKHVGRAIRAAYRGCSYPGCTMPAHRCELDHLQPWEKGGQTNVDNVDLYCKIHHLARHSGLFKVVKVQGCRPMVLLPRNLDPPQKLRVNTFWMSPDEAIEANRLAAQATELYRAGRLEPFAA